MIDVHVLLTSTTPLEWAASCFVSIVEAIDRANYPVTLHLVPAVPGHIGKARANAYALGEYPYVTYVDEDDWLHADAFLKLKPLLDQLPEAITTGEVVVFEDGSQVHNADRKHHLAVFKREFIAGLSLEDFKLFPDQYALHEADSVHLPECLYYYRNYENSGSRALRQTEFLRAEQELKAFNADLATLELLSPLELKVKLDRELRNA